MKDDIVFFENKEKRELILDIDKRLKEIFSQKLNQKTLQVLIERIDYLIGKRDKQNKINKSQISKALSCVKKDVSKTINTSHILWIIPAGKQFFQKKESLYNVRGFSLGRLILLFVRPKKWSYSELREVFAHELAHVIRSGKKTKNCLGEHIVAEGLAEYFSYIINGKTSKRASYINKYQQANLLKYLKEKLEHFDENLYSKLFFRGNKKGYSLGYSLILDWVGYKKNQKDLRSLLLVDYKKIIFNQMDGLSCPSLD